MNCPVCKVELKMADHQGVEIDYCPQCRGVWLDWGELDEIAERPAQTGGSLRKVTEPYRVGAYRQTRYSRKKKSFPGDMCDFD